mmetsp:Transcript_38626/g.46598  ORF Transcript_38626/g.46598 Transcript_38626/m.46598 type:complete len:399 (-) Transcript_38626:99-1295(-)
MNLRIAIFHISIITAFAVESIQSNVGLDTAIKAGSKLLSKAKLVDSRQLNDAEVDYSWIADYSIKFSGCHSFYNFASEEGGDGGGGDDDMAQNFYNQKMITFNLCNSNSCNSNNKKTCSGGGQYIVGMDDFLNAYIEAKEEEKEYNCEVVKENCYCNDDTDDEVCEQQCYEDAGLDYCIEVEYDDDRVEEFDVQEYLECKEMEMNGNNNNNNNYQYFIGPKCSSDGSSINLGVFTDENCMTAANDGIYQKYNYGNSLPYSSESVIGNDCMSCLAPNDADDDGGDDGGEVELTELCQEMYESSGKCEQDMSGLYYPNNGGCDYINNILPAISKVYSGSSSSATRAAVTNKVSSLNDGDVPYLAVGLGVTTLLLSGLVLGLHSKIKNSRRSIDLSQQGVV